MLEIKVKKTIIVVLAIGLLIAAGIYQYIKNGQDTLALLQQGEPAVAEFANVAGDYPSYRLLNDRGELLGYGVIATASGYGGKLYVLSVINPLGEITSVTLLEDSETPLYLHKVIDSGLIQKLTATQVDSGFSEIDMVTGATLTSEAIFNSVRKGAVQIGNDYLGKDIQIETGINFGGWDAAAAILIVGSAIASIRNIKGLRPWLLVGSVLLLGFYLNYSIAYRNFIDLLIGNVPVFIERPFWYILVPGIFLSTFFLGRNFYCSWLCPFGAVQEGLYKSLNLVKFSPSPKIKAAVRKARWPVLWLAALISILLNNPGIAGYEPFYVFFDSNGTTAQWIILIIVILMSTLQLRFWCNGFCPTGMLLNEVAALKRRLKKLNLKKADTFWVSSTNASVSFGLQGIQSEMSRQDKVYAFASMAVIILVVVSLIENVWQ